MGLWDCLEEKTTAAHDLPCNGKFGQLMQISATVGGIYQSHPDSMKFLYQKLPSRHQTLFPGKFPVWFDMLRSSHDINLRLVRGVPTFDGTGGYFCGKSRSNPCLSRRGQTDDSSGEFQPVNAWRPKTTNDHQLGIAKESVLVKWGGCFIFGVL